LIQRLDARKGEFRDGHWELMDCMAQILNKNNGYDIVLNDKRKETLELLPQDLKQIVRQSTEMNYAELRDYVHKVESEGYDGTVYKVDLYAKSAYPFVCIIMGLVGIGLTARKKLNSGLPLSITYGLVIGFSYWIFQSFCVSLGYGGLLPPLPAAWAANFIFLCGGLLLVLYAE
jgi:lipopolysaccharide export system permease protein